MLSCLAVVLRTARIELGGTLETNKIFEIQAFESQGTLCQICSSQEVVFLSSFMFGLHCPWVVLGSSFSRAASWPSPRHIVPGIWAVRHWDWIAIACLSQAGICFAGLSRRLGVCFAVHFHAEIERTVARAKGFSGQVTALQGLMLA